MQKRNDLKLILGLFALSLLLLLLQTGVRKIRGAGSISPISGGSGAGSVRTAVVSQDGKEIGRYPLDQEFSLVITSPSGGTNTLEISGGKARVINASCPDHICEKTGWVLDTGEVIVCMPNRLIVRIE